MYLQLNSDGSVIYPLSLLTFYRSNSGVSFPSSPSDALLAEFEVYPVTPVAQPDYDAATQAVTEAVPVQIDGVWTQQ